MDIDDENCKGCLNSNDGEPVLWFLTRKVKGKIEYLQVGHNDSLKLMFTNDIKYDLYDLLYGDGKRKGKYNSLREEISSFSFYAVYIDDFVQNVNVFFDSREIKLSSEIVDALYNNDSMVHLQCSICKNEWDSTYREAISNHKCPYCKPEKWRTISNPEKRYSTKISELSGGTLEVSEYKGYRSIVRVKCSVCGYEWTSVARSLVEYPYCRYCKKKRNN